MDNKYLNKIRNNLNGFFCYFKDKDILVISEDKSVMPFAYLISDEINYPGKLLLSLATDFPFCDKAVHVALCANRVRETVLSDQFFISNSGITYLGEEADRYHQLEIDLPLDQIMPLTNTKH